MVGNDILDLNFVDTPGYHHVGYLDHVCTPAESQAVRDSADPSRSLAVVWASKEAAFKLFSKRLSCLRCFVPRQFVTQAENGAPLDSATELTVTHGGISSVVAVSGTGQWVHAMATFVRGQAVAWAIQNIWQKSSDHVTTRSESAAVRALARQLLLDCGFENAAIEFVGRTPRVTRKGLVCSNIGISLSHHGAFVSAAIALPAETSTRLSHRFLQVPSWGAACSTCTA